MQQEVVVVRAERLFCPAELDVVPEDPSSAAEPGLFPLSLIIPTQFVKREVESDPEIEDTQGFEIVAVSLLDAAVAREDRLETRGPSVHPSWEACFLPP